LATGTGGGKLLTVAGGGLRILHGGLQSSQVADNAELGLGGPGGRENERSASNVEFTQKSHRNSDLAAKMRKIRKK
jgi:hypothetical protein